MTPYAHSPARRAARRAALVAVVGAVLCAFWAPAASAAGAPAAGTGWIRLAHLSPDTPDVDIYLAPFGGSGRPLVLRGVGYGEVSAYQAVAAGTYTASMRLAGASGSSTPVLRANARVTEGEAYTAAAVGLKASLAVKVLEDDLTPPPTGKGRVRLIQASTQASAVDVTAVGGPLLAEGARFGRATGYAAVPAGRWMLRVTPRDGNAGRVTAAVDVPAGSVGSILVLDGAQAGTLKVATTVDSEGATAMPRGGARTGYGPSEGGSSLRVPAAAAGVLLSGATVFLLRRRWGARAPGLHAR